MDGSVVRARTVEVTPTITKKPPSRRVGVRNEATEHFGRNLSNCDICDGMVGRGVDGAYRYADLRLCAVVCARIDSSMVVSASNETLLLVKAWV